jgi:hypothetical protein
MSDPVMALDEIAGDATPDEAERLRGQVGASPGDTL